MKNVSNPGFTGLTNERRNTSFSAVKGATIAREVVTQALDPALGRETSVQKEVRRLFTLGQDTGLEILGPSKNGHDSHYMETVKPGQRILFLA